MTRALMKLGLSTMASDMGILQKIPTGRLDELADHQEQLPEFIVEWVPQRFDGYAPVPTKGTKAWRLVRDFLVEGKVPKKQKAA